MAFAAPVAVPAMLAATEAGGAGMMAAAAAEAAAAATAAGLGASAIPGIAATAAGSAVPGMAAPAMTAAGTQGLAGAMGQQLAPVFTAGVNTAGLPGMNGGTVMGTVLPGMNQGANLLTTPFAKFLDTVGPMAKKANSAYQMGSKFGNALAGQQQQAQRPLQPPAPAPQINPMPQQTQRTPTPVELLAWRRAQQRKRMMGQQGGMMS